MRTLVALAGYYQWLSGWNVQAIERDEWAQLPNPRIRSGLRRYDPHLSEPTQLTKEVTLYGENVGPLSCSSPTKIVGHLATCYDSSWVYYSIDGCLPPVASPAKASMKPTATGPSATKDASSTSEPKTHTGVIVGSTVAGVSCVLLGVTGALLILRRRRKMQTTKPSHELSEDRALAESDAAAEKKHPRELWGDHAAIEIGRNSRFEGMMRDVRPDTIGNLQPKMAIEPFPPPSTREAALAFLSKIFEHRQRRVNLAY
ncbi:hypothetical protein OPT61_g4429 [Boeremia exigua]|uniref:Uncharacterized protein n=1 Tax=Boeremia exigua TaxID=749465 RepID=A0ACC2IE56_9PLEO|nr:hypothetical protein OPT61_g4429 [Boeremia exigua]